MHLEVVGSTPLRFADGSPVRAASGDRARTAPAGWSSRTTPPTAACGATAPARPLRLLSRRPRARPLRRGRGHQGAQAGPRGRRGAARRPHPGPRLGVDPRADALRPAVRGRRSRSPGWPRSTPRWPRRSSVPPDQLNLEGAAVVGEVLRWFQRGLPVRRRAERQRRRRPGQPPRGRRRAARPRSGSPACAATTSGRSPAWGSRSPTRSRCRDGLVLVSAAAEDSPSTYDDGPVVGSALALLDGERLVDAGRAAAARRRGRQGRGARPGCRARRRPRPGRGRRRRRPAGALAAAGADRDSLS